MQTCKKNTNIKFLLLTLVFVFPIIGSWLLYDFRDHFQFKTVNHGNLVNPPVNVSDLIQNDSKQRQWKIVLAPIQCCDDKCEKVMFTLHQLRIALGKDSDRVSLGLVVNTTCQPKEIHDFKKIVFTDKQYTQLQTAVIHAGKNNFVAKDKVYLVDPLGNLFMFYDIASNPMDILKDMKKVLEVSQIG